MFLSGGDIHQSLVGMSEKVVERAFKEAQENAPCIFFIDEIKSAGKTKEMVAFLKAFGMDKSVLIVMDNSDELVLRACANIKAITTVPASMLNTYEVVRNAKIVMSKKAVEIIEEAYGK